ncbi:MAG: ChaB family protein [Candidatus Izemoplasmatales bacterium]
MGELFNERTWHSIIDAIYAQHSKIEIPSNFKDRVNQIDILLDNDYTGVVKTVYEFMVSTATVPFTFVTDNENLTNTLQNWANNELNRNVNIDVSKGLRDLSTQYFRERWRSSFIVLNIVWDKINNYILPSRIWISDSKDIEVKGKLNILDGRKYYFGEKELISNDKKTVLIRKPFDPQYKNMSTPYLVGKGVLYNSKVKESLVKKQADILEEIIPYLLLLKAGDANLLQKNMLTNLDSDLNKLKESLQKYKRDHKYRTDSGDSILKGRYDLSVEHFIPELGKIFNESIIKPVNWNILAGLGLIELEGFGGSRQEAIWNPKVLVEEINDAVLDWQLLLEEIVQLIIEKNASLHRKQMNKDIRIVPGVVKAFLTDAMKKLIKDYANTGQLSVEDSFEALPFGFDFEINRKRRLQERERGDEDLFFPRVILNQDSNERMDAPVRPNVTPNEIPKKKKKDEEEEAKTEDLEAPYQNIDQLPESVKKALPIPAQIIFLKAFNSALKQGKDEETAFKIAWQAVKNAGYYKPKDSDKWKKK